MPTSSNKKRKVLRTEAYIASERKALKPYQLSQQATHTAINSLAEGEPQGDVYPGITPALRKVRLPLSEYKIGKSGGLRLLFMISEKLFLPVFLYFKGQFAHEHEIKKAVREQLKKVLAEMSASSKPNY
ncbi:hypothetical protein DDE01_06520 [Desulfovibrio desulfuricans]|nr:hypothetical protein DDE01_06520 [Desulfovibrio desulfuricans]